MSTASQEGIRNKSDVENIYESLKSLHEEHGQDKYFKKFTLILGIILLIAALPYLFNGTAKIVKSFRNMRGAFSGD